MKYLLYPFYLLYRIWFYLLVLLPILIFFPLLLITIYSEKTYSIFFKIARIWAKFILVGMGWKVTIEGKENLDKYPNYVFIANHTSMSDIMLMLRVVAEHPFVFVGKKELVKIPIFGFIYKRVCIMVDRNSSKSRYEVFERAQKRVNQGLSICIFPEGGVPEEQVVLDAFKDGAFRIAIEHQLPILPMTFFDNKKRFSFSFFSGSIGIMHVKIHPPIITKGLNIDSKNEIKNKCRILILNNLMENISK